MRKKSIEEMIQDLDYKVKYGNLNEKAYENLKKQIQNMVIKESEKNIITNAQEKEYMDRITLIHQERCKRTGQPCRVQAPIMHENISTSDEVISQAEVVEQKEVEQSSYEQVVSAPVEDKIPEPKNVNKSWWKAHKKQVLILAGTLTLGSVAIGSLTLALNAKRSKVEESKITTEVENGNNILGKEAIMIGQMSDHINNANQQVQNALNNIDFANLSMIQSSLSENLAFDINDNEELIERSAQFIARCRPCGVDMSDPKSISKFMDYIHTLNYEQIDPMDYARYGYFTKTSNSIVDNYQEIGNPLVEEDLFSVTEGTLIPYDLIIADKESAKVIMDLQTLVAQYNEADKKDKKTIQKEIETFLYDNFIYEDARTFGSTVYEVVGRFGIIIDQMLPNGLPKDIMNKLSNDLYTCGIKIPEGEQHKSERAQNETSIRTTLEEKLLYALNCRIQDLSILPEIEVLLGSEVEQRIADRVAELNLPFVKNPEAKEAKTTIIPIKSAESVTLSNGQQVSENDVKSVGLDPATVTKETYEKAKEQQFEENAKADSSHTFTTQGGVTTSGSAVEKSIELAAQGTSDGYSDVKNNISRNYRYNDPSYISAYNAAYDAELANKARIDESVKQKEETTFVPSVEQPVVSETEQIVEQPAQSPVEVPVTPVPESSPNPEETVQVPQESSTTTFVPIEEEIVEEIVGETVEESGYEEEVTYSGPIAFNHTISDIQTQIANLMFVKEVLIQGSSEYELNSKAYCMKI